MYFHIFAGAMVAYEGVPLHSPYFAKLWYEIYHTEVRWKQTNVSLGFIKSELVGKKINDYTSFHMWQFHIIQKMFNEVLVYLTS